MMPFAELQPPFAPAPPANPFARQSTLIPSFVELGLIRLITLVLATICVVYPHRNPAHAKCVEESGQSAKGEAAAEA